MANALIAGASFLERPQEVEPAKTAIRQRA